MHRQDGRAWWRDIIAHLGGIKVLLGILFCTALPVVPFALLLASVMGRYWKWITSFGGGAGTTLVLWLLVAAWVIRGSFDRVDAIPRVVDEVYVRSCQGEQRILPTDVALPPALSAQINADAP